MADPTDSEIVSALKQAILKHTTHGVHEYHVGHVRYEYDTLDELFGLLEKFEDRVATAAGTRTMILHADVSRRAR